MFYAYGHNPYEGLNEDSTNEDRLNVVFESLKIGEWKLLDYQKLFIKGDKIKMFNVILKETELVDFQQSPTAYNPQYKLNNKGFIVFDKFASYKEYLQSLKPQIKFKEDIDTVVNYLLKHYSEQGIIMRDKFHTDTGVSKESPVIPYLKGKGIIAGTISDIYLTPEGYAFAIGIPNALNTNSNEETHNHYADLIVNMENNSGQVSIQKIKDSNVNGNVTSSADRNIKESFNKNEETSEQKDLSKKSLNLSQQSVRIGIAAIIVAILLVMWQQGCFGR